MAYSEDALKSRLAALNETQDSIVSVSQWIMFHKRHADRIANFWLTRLRDSAPAKRLNYIYLVNDIVQNARAKKRTEFPDAFSPLMPEACQTAYRSSTPEIQNKIRRVVEVWKQRNVFEAPIIQAIETRLNEVDQAKGGSGKKTLMGKSIYGSSSGGMPKELETLGPLQNAMTKASIDSRPIFDAAEREYTKLNSPDFVPPTLPLYAANLSSLIKSLAAAEAAVTNSMKTRQALITDLERILEKNKTALESEEESLAEMTSRKTATEAKKRDVEDAIAQQIGSPSNSPEAPDTEAIGGSGKRSSSFLDERPEVEELTPEPEDEHPFSPPPVPDEPAVYEGTTPPLQSPANNPAVAAALSGFGEAPSTSRVRVASAGSLNGSSAKRRKMSHDQDEAVPDLGEMGLDILGQGAAVSDPLADLDADVDELLRQQGGGTV